MNVIIVYADRIQFGSGSSSSKGNFSFEEPVSCASNDDRLDVFEQVIAGLKQKEPLAILFGPRHAVRYELPIGTYTHKSNQALKFACEEQIPLPAEQIETDVVDGSRLGVAIESGFLNSLLEICERYQVEVVHNGFVDLEAMQWLMNADKLNATGVLLIDSESGISVLGFRDGQPETWDWFPDDCTNEGLFHGDTAGFRLSILATNKPYYLVNAPDELAEFFPPDERQVIDMGLTIEEMAARNAIAVSSGRIKPFITLQSETHRPHGYLTSALSILLVSIAMLLVSASVYLWVQGTHFANQANDIESELQQLYKDNIPGGPPTSLIARALKARLADIEQDTSAMELTQSNRTIQQNLHRLLSAIPEDIEFELDSLGIKPQSIAIGGSVMAIDDLVAIKGCLENAGFEITTRDLRKQFNMTLIPPHVVENLE